MLLQILRQFHERRDEYRKGTNIKEVQWTFEAQFAAHQAEDQGHNSESFL